MDIKTEIKAKLDGHLKSYNKKTITLAEMAVLFGGEVSYEEFAAAVSALADSGVLMPVKSAGYSSRTPRLPNKYKINNGKIRESFQYDLESMAVTLHKKIDLTYYYTRPQAVWEDDKENILKLDRYLKSVGLPESPAGAPERSYHIFGDEKLIDEKHGKRLLQRICLYDEMKITSGCDPAMLFINPERIGKGRHEYIHLIIENRTPFYVLAEMLRGSALTTLVYGAGFQILSSVMALERQIALSGERHRYFYFGDMDYTGISIWNGVSERVNAEPAADFYRELLMREPAFGKEYQQHDDKSLERFLLSFDRAEQEKIQSVLAEGRYHPQEALAAPELRRIFLKNFGGDGHGA